MNERAMKLAEAIRNGAWLKHTTGPHCEAAAQVRELLDAVAPVPEPVKVDWTRPIRQRGEGRATVECIGELKSKTKPRKVIRETFPSGDQAVYTVRADGIYYDSEKHIMDIINVPAPEPVELKYEVAVGRHPKWGECRAIKFGEFIRCLGNDGRLTTLGPANPPKYWTFSPWQPASVKG